VTERVSVAMAEITGSMREGLLALAVGTSPQFMQVMPTLMEAEATALVGLKGRHDPTRTRSATVTSGSVSLGSGGCR
jgi:hypothetical protein